MQTHITQQNNQPQTRSALELVMTNSAVDQALDKARNAGAGTGRIRREINVARLDSLRAHIKEALIVDKHDIEKAGEVAIYYIDLRSDRAKTQIQHAFSKWLTEVGMEQKLDGIRAINTFSEKVEALKGQISTGNASAKVKDRLQRLAELIVDDLFTLLFKEAAERLLLQETNN